MNTPADSDSTSGHKAPAFQFYPTDFISGTLTLTTEEIGAYILLLCHCWDKGGIPKQLTLLARIAKLTPAKMRKAWMSLSAKFVERGGQYIQPRMERERQKQADYRRRQSDKGKASAEARRNTPPVEPRLDSGSSPVQAEREPEGNSSVFGLQSSSSDFSQGRIERVPTRGMGGGALAGMLPRDHARHSWCGRVCVPDFLHGRFVKAVGGDDSDRELRDFYDETFKAIPENQPVESDPTKFWPPRVSVRWPSQGVAEGTRTQALRRASTEFLKS